MIAAPHPHYLEGTMGLLGWIGVALAVVVGIYLLQLIYLAGVLSWETEKTIGLAYYGLSPAGRARFKRTLRVHAILLSPILWLSGKTSRFTFQKASFQHRGIAGPMGSCNPESFARADSYQPTAADVFVVTQMKCGTTWMQHVVYQVLLRGKGNLVESGTALYAVSPWIEALKSVPIDQAPMIGTERPSRIVKTHLPVELCPWSGTARYIYVARHPVSCFASCIDFVNTNAGAMAPPLPVYEEWFCSPSLMWWGTWTNHVKGWWDRAQKEKNVLFLYFEDMKKDLPTVIRQVSDFVGMKPLTDPEIKQVAEKCSFKYMQQHQEAFEMHPPHLLQTNAELFVRGTANRQEDVAEDLRRRVGAWSAREMAESEFPLGRVYPDVIKKEDDVIPKA